MCVFKNFRMHDTPNFDLPKVHVALKIDMIDMDSYIQLLCSTENRFLKKTVAF